MKLRKEHGMWRSPFTREYGLELPFISAGMGFVALPELVAAVSNAGGLGLLGVAPAPAQLMHEMVSRTKSLTTRPFGVDLIVEETAFGPCTTEQHIEVCLAERVPVVVFFWHLPPRDWVTRLHAGGAKVWMTARLPHRQYGFPWHDPNAETRRSIPSDGNY